MKEARLRTESGDIRAADIASLLDAHTGNGAIEIEGCASSVEADTNSGGIAIRQARSQVKATTGNGSVEAELARGYGLVQIDLTGTIGVDLQLPENVSALVEADNDAGGFEFEMPGVDCVRRGRTHLEAVLGNGQGSVCLRTSDGAIRVRAAGE